MAIKKFWTLQAETILIRTTKSKRKSATVLLLAVGTNALDEVVRCVHLESLWQSDRRDGCVGQAEGRLAALAEEMHVGVVVGVVVVAQAKFIDEGVVTVFDGMDEVFFPEEGEHPEYARLVECDEPVFQFCK